MVVFGTSSKKNLRWILLIAKLQSENCYLQSIIFRYISICGEEANYIKKYIKAMR